MKARRAIETVLSGLAAGVVLTAQMNLLQRLSPEVPFTEEFVRFLAGARWGSSDVIAGFLVIGILLALIFSWYERGLGSSLIVKGMKYGLILWMVQSLYIAWQPVLFLFHQPVATSLLLSALFLPWNLATGITISFVFTRLQGTSSPSAHPKEFASEVTLGRFRVIVSIALTGLLAGLIAQGAWFIFAQPYNWWINVILDLGSQSERFITIARAGGDYLFQFPNGDPTTLILLSIPLTISYAMIRRGLAGSIWRKGVMFGFMIYVFRYVWREWMGDFALIHQPLALTPFFLATEIVRALVEGLAIVFIYETISPAILGKKKTALGTN